MATRINPDFYGAENTFVNNSTSTKRSAYSIGDLMNGGVYTGGSLDFSASPWGVGASSVSSDFIFALGKSDVWTFNLYENKKGNTPIWFYTPKVAIGGDIANDILGEDATTATFANVLYKNRISPSAKLASNLIDIKSTLPIDDDSTVSLQGTQSLFPVTYANYQNLRAVIYDVWYKAEGNNAFQHCEFRDLVNGTVTNIDSIIAFWVDIRERSNGSASGINASVGGSELDIPAFYKSCYYDSGNNDKWVRPWRTIHTIGAPFWSRTDLSMTFAQFGSADAVLYQSDFETVTPSNIANNRNNTNIYGHISTKKQVFDDVSYHWEIGIMPYGSNPWTGEIIENGDTYESGTYFTYVYMALDGEYANKTDAYIKAILHEVAFFGFPFADEVHITETIGGANTYLPVFNEHMITTGEYVKGSASLELPNASWTDIFGAEMPEYDPEYDPDTPPDPDEDYGYLDNKPLTYRSYSSNNRVYALTAAQYNQFIKDVNSLYLDDPDTGFASFQLDFKGTNPSDYIVGAYGYTFLPAYLDPNQQPEHIQVGAVTLPNAEGYRITPSYIWNVRILGEIDLTGAGDFKPFGDFRDYEPYTHIELYIPLCGNIELDPAAVVGHIINIEIVYDIMTGNATACVYRDNSTLIATVAGQLAASLPLTSGRMGDYQNAVKSAENALKQNELKTTTAAATVAMGVGAALLAPETGGLSLAAYGAAITGGASLMSLSNQKNQIEYEIKHKQPSISVCSSANGTVAQNISSMRAVCYVKQCKMLSSYNAATYAHTVGHATVKNTTIGAEATEDSNSLIVCSNADISGIPATAAEINAIQSLLTGGVYV